MKNTLTHKGAVDFLNANRGKVAPADLDLIADAFNRAFGPYDTGPQAGNGPILAVRNASGERVKFAVLPNARIERASGRPAPATNTATKAPSAPAKKPADAKAIKKGSD